MATNKTYDEFTFITKGQDLGLGGTITVKSGAYILVSGSDNAFDLTEGPWKFKTDGLVQSDLQSAIVIHGDIADTKVANSTITVGIDGTVWGGGGNGILAEQATNVVNSGLIHGSAFGIREQLLTPSSSKSISITNNAAGTIEGDFAIESKDISHDLVVKNAGTIDGTVAIEFGRGLQLTNTGSIVGEIQSFSGGNFASKITNSGSIDAKLVTYAVGLGSGDDVVSNTGVIWNGIALADGNNTVTNSGLIGGPVAFGNGNNKLTNTDRMLSNIEFGNGVNTFTNSGVIDAAVTFLGSGTNTVKNTKSITGAIDFGHGNNNVTNGGTFESTVTFGNGDNVFKNTGTIVGALDFGDGNNHFTNSGDIQVSMAFGSGNDIMTNSAELLLSVNMGDGNNSFINTGILHASINFGAGDDVFKSTKSSISRITMGDGNDTFFGGSGADEVQDGKGDDSYSLGAGNDRVIYAGSGIDTFDGGAGVDEFTAVFASGGLFINLDSKAFSFSSFTAAGNSINTIPFGGQVGTIKGIENVRGTANADIIHGSSGADQIDGYQGADFIIGGLGGDVLVSTADSSVDTFVYLSTKDSGPGKATRDTITGFEGAGGSGGDVIDLQAIDADTKTANDQAFHFIGADKAFTKAVGELRTITEGENTIIQGDVNGDGKADFSIAVVGLMTFDKDFDFVL